MEFLQPGSLAKPALRKGVNLVLWHYPSRGLRVRSNQLDSNKRIEPKRDAHFDPGDGSRSLDAVESFEAMRLELTDWFDLTQPGNYQFQFTFSADSGLGEGSSGAVYFKIRGDE
jgi:hypothetical protein